MKNAVYGLSPGRMCPLARCCFVHSYTRSRTSSFFSCRRQLSPQGIHPTPAVTCRLGLAVTVEHIFYARQTFSRFASLCIEYPAFLRSFSLEPHRTASIQPRSLTNLPTQAVICKCRYPRAFFCSVGSLGCVALMWSKRGSPARTTWGPDEVRVHIAVPCEDCCGS